MGKHDNLKLVGSILDKKYRVTELLGEGGMGAVYKGEHQHLKRACAIKVIRRQLAADPTALKRFQLEAEAASILKHPNIIEIYDFGVTDDELAYIVMEYLPGESLDDTLERQKFIHYEQLIPIFLQICDALIHAHDKNILHRDLKPANIMVVSEVGADNVQVKLVDFGVAKLLPGTGRSVEKLTLTGEVFGSPMYMSPEQCMGQALDLRSDVYALGCMLYELLTGKLPFVGDSLFDVVMKHVNENPPTFSEVAPDIAIPKQLEDIVFQCLSKERSLRFANVRDLRKKLASIYTVRQFKNMQPPEQTRPATADPPSQNTTPEDGAPVNNDTQIDKTSNFGTKKFEQHNSLDDDIDHTVSFSTNANSQNIENKLERSLLDELERLEKKLGHNCRFQIAPLSGLFRLYRDEGNYEKAIEAKRRQLFIVIEQEGKDSIDAADCYEDLGHLYSNIDANEKAENCFTENFRIRSTKLGPDDLSSCKAAVLLAKSLRKTSKQSQAEQLADDAISKIHRVFGHMSLDTADVEYMVGNFYYDLENFDKAFLHFSMVENIYRNLLGEFHINRKDALLDMGRCMYWSNKFEETVTYCELAIKVDEANPHSYGIAFEYPWAMLSWACQKLGRWGETEHACLRSIEILESIKDIEPDRFQLAFDTLADVYEETGQFEKAKIYRTKARNVERNL